MTSHHNVAMVTVVKRNELVLVTVHVSDGMKGNRHSHITWSTPSDLLRVYLVLYLIFDGLVFKILLKFSLP